jgi:uncharacterized membrane protein YraQ (UPF0718 family)
VKKERWLSVEYGTAVVFGLFIVLMQLLGWQIGRTMAFNFYEFSLKMIVLVPCIFVLIGILDVWVPKEAIQKHIGEESGVKGVFYVVLLAFFQGGPLYAAFPVAHLLCKKGASRRNIFVYIGAFSTLKVPMVMFEISFLGWKFSLVRAAASLPVFILIAEIMTRYARQKVMPMEKMG